MKVLAIGAHPDDIEIFMLGTLLSYKARNDDVFVAVATDGAAGQILDFPKLAATRKLEAKKGLKLIGKPHFFDFPDGKLATTERAQGKIKEYILHVSPDIIITHAPEDYHPDHVALANIVKLATGFLCPILFADTLMGLNFTPDYYVDITPYFPKKCKAILQHKSQCPEKFLEACKLQNSFRSAQCNAKLGKYAEAFRHDKSFPFADVRSLLPNDPGINIFYRSSPHSLI